ncbi:hypothetical protein DID88_009772 [Monilinia fructigena]|uniref:Uncharacterized protein n=1 Tax=Monilinia fructigena TaxID=38457 RepID=A0A395IK72_9HELO|nr:hypothetical protein DID88_009772 [Monilinia fructigena]
MILISVFSAQGKGQGQGHSKTDQSYTHFSKAPTLPALVYYFGCLRLCRFCRCYSCPSKTLIFAAIYAAAPPAETGPAPTATKEFVSINNVSASAEGASKATALATAVATAPQNAKRNGWSWGGGSGGYGGKYGASSSSSTSTSICTTSTTAAVATSSATASTTVAPPATTPYVSTPCATQPDGLRTKGSTRYC